MPLFLVTGYTDTTPYMGETVRESVLRIVVADDEGQAVEKFENSLRRCETGGTSVWASATSADAAIE